MNLTPYLEDIERRLNDQEEQAIYDAWYNFAMGKNAQSPFQPPVRTPSEPSVEWKHVNVNDALDDYDMMILSQLERCHKALSSASDKMMIMRANYGVGNIASMYGARPFIMAYDRDTLPNVYPIGGGADGIRRLLDQPEPDMTAGNAKKIFTIGERFAEIREKYPKIARWVRFDAPDAQGPMDNCELLWGSEIFYDLYDEPELVHAFLRRLTGTIRRIVEKWYEYIPNTDNLASYFGHVGRGRIVIRDDSAMNLSPEFFDEFIRPYDSELLTHFGGGLVHFCGRGDHFIPRMATIENLTAVDMSQPHLNDMDVIFSSLADQGICMFLPRGDYSIDSHDGRFIYSY